MSGFLFLFNFHSVSFLIADLYTFFLTLSEYFYIFLPKNARQKYIFLLKKHGDFTFFSRVIKTFLRSDKIKNVFCKQQKIKKMFFINN